MAQIKVTDLTFCYEGSFDDIFTKVSFSIDTDWKLGFIGRNGKGKTTFLKLLMGELPYEGTISTSLFFDYFPYRLPEGSMDRCASAFLEELKPGCEEWRIICELGALEASAELLYRPFGTLSHGERTKVLLAILFSGDNDFLLIDEPTDHLDQEARESVKRYLKGKKSFLLVSHDRALLDACIDHVLVLERETITVQRGDFSTWWEEKSRRDHFARAENEKHLREIASLRKAADRSGRWAQKNENSKIGFDPTKEHDRSIATRAYIGAKTKKMESRVKQYEKRLEREIRGKEGLLKDIEEPVSLKLMPLTYHKERLIECRELALGYGDGPGGKAVGGPGGKAAGRSGGKAAKGTVSRAVLRDLTFEIKRGERVLLSGKNGCGKSTLIKAILAAGQSFHGPTADRTEGLGTLPEVVLAPQVSSGQLQAAPAPQVLSGQLQVGSGLKISYVSQDTSFLKGTIWDFCEARGLKESLFCALLRQLDMERVQFEKDMSAFSEGQKKKVLLAASLLTPAHLYIWDEPLNYIDVFSRMQIEELILTFQPTMLLVEHDQWFQKKIGTRVVELDRWL